MTLCGVPPVHRDQVSPGAHQHDALHGRLRVLVYGYQQTVHLLPDALVRLVDKLEAGKGVWGEEEEAKGQTSETPPARYPHTGRAVFTLGRTL